MKKLISFLAALLLTAAFLPRVSAAPSGIVPGSVKQNASASDITWTFSFAAENVRVYEEARKAGYNEAYKKYEELKKDPVYSMLTFESYMRQQGEDAQLLLYPLEILCEATPENGLPCAVRAAKADAGSMSVSLFKDILPALIQQNAYGEAEREGFTFTLTAAAALNMDGEYKTGDFDRIPLGTFTAPATVYINYDLPSDADNKNNPAFRFYPAEDIPLENPTREGYTFTGWTDEAGNALDMIPAGTRYIKLTAGWQIRNFQIRCILTTRSGYDFIKCKNPNPVYFSAEEDIELANASAPSGWVFAGWFADEKLTGEPVTKIPKGTAHDVRLYAKWLTEEEALNEKIAAAHWGDIDSDGKTTAADARLALRSAVGLEKYGADIIARADFAGQGRLSADSARTLLRIAVGLDSIKGILKLYNII